MGDVGDAAPQYIRHLGIDVPEIAFAEFDADRDCIVSQRYFSENFLQAFPWLGDLFRYGLMSRLSDAHVALPRDKGRRRLHAAPMA